MDVSGVTGAGLLEDESPPFRLAAKSPSACPGLPCTASWGGVSGSGYGLLVELVVPEGILLGVTLRMWLAMGLECIICPSCHMMD